MLDTIEYVGNIIFNIVMALAVVLLMLLPFIIGHDLYMMGF